MYKWKIEIILSSGRELTAYYKGDEISSGDVVNKIFTGNINNLVGLSNKDDTKNVFVKLGEIAAIVVSVT